MAKPTSPLVAASRIAARYVERSGLVPPVDVEALLAELGVSVERAGWPINGVDAITYGLATERPTVFVRATDNLMRERFTIAHEVGHIILPWHLPRSNCAVGEAQLDGPETSENEADIFASCLLVPDAWLRTLFAKHGGDMSLVLGELDVAEVSTPAALLAMRRHLLAGWVFERARDGKTFATPGTEMLGRSLTDAPAQGQTSLNGETVRWYCFHDPDLSMPDAPQGDKRTAHAVLVDSLQAEGHTAENATRIAQQLNGKVGGTLRASLGRPAAESYAAMCHRLSVPEFAPLLQIEGVRLWLAERCRGVEEGKTKRRRGGKQ